MSRRLSALGLALAVVLLSQPAMARQNNRGGDSRPTGIAPTKAYPAAQAPGKTLPVPQAPTKSYPAPQVPSKATPQG